MKNKGLILSLFFISVLILYNCSHGKEQSKENSNGDLTESDVDYLSVSAGNSIQIDPSVLYSTGISPKQFISDLKKANIKTVHFFIVNAWDGNKDDLLFREEYMKALNENNIGVWLMILGNGFYGETTLPEEWEMGLLTPYPGVSLYSFHNEDYVKWQIQRVKRILANYKFIGIEFAESYFPEWKTIENNGFYGDVSSFAIEKFTKEYLKIYDKVLSFDDIRFNKDLYEKWIDFRADAILNFNKKMKDAVKSTDSNVLFASWGIGIRNGSLEEIKEHFGLDMVRIVKEVKPDIFYIQTAAQDWGDANLKPDYLKEYSYIVDALKKIDPNIHLGIQTDIASLSYHNTNVPKRDGIWWQKFMDQSLLNGYYTNTAYEYSFYKKQGLWVN